ncbi:hypothetical protein A3C59_05370 [Candidatus Daviesbacteria bacterium RIFCSPHIGHO2_02_FULL_36_13]|uniref:Uncharacterized protein n=1 Tax=Candidatus Daviesbacteria bacterium RIFCSPHIGHO2_02_FULL_36_13 TaxID=1797768 RepID=A0A1F5JZB8_9BACT|nr:MAG: hypothetical protein A3C59_05370 [Candidatus Daviesbacteria bacterium RIFCSPHIGHO2_02_FULL_36_13]OGE42728.1 MAG: hypothetical protein A3A45_03595 [Candidatus Daviesbacteria bacterium RIFCSPLOWO2_01_FULL_36_8]
MIGEERREWRPSARIGNVGWRSTDRVDTIDPATVVTKVITSIPEAHMDISKMVAGVEGVTVTPCATLDGGKMCEFATIKGCVEKKMEGLTFDPERTEVLCSRTREPLTTVQEQI